jgi:hypothetical protein
MGKVHHLLERQLKEHLGHIGAIPSRWEALINAVSDTYRQIDLDRGMRERGCRGFIQKPYSMGDLSQKIRAVLDG